MTYCYHCPRCGATEERNTLTAPICRSAAHGTRGVRMARDYRAENAAVDTFALRSSREGVSYVGEQARKMDRPKRSTG